MKLVAVSRLTYNHDMLVERRQMKAGDHEVVVLGTRIITPDALEALDAEIRASEPDEVVLDFDATRWRWLGVLAGEEQVDLVQVIRSGQMGELNARLAMGVLDKSTAPRSEVPVNAEILAAHATATELGANVVFGRRACDVEMLRAWRKLTLGGRFGFAWRLLKGSLRRTQLDPETVDAAGFNPDEAMASARECAGDASKVVWDESSTWLADTLRKRGGKKVTVVTTACSLDALETALSVEIPTDELERVPPKSLFSRIVPWAFTALIIGAFVLGFVYADPEKMEQAMFAWFASNMSFAALGALLALAHPVTIIATSLSAPFVSLNPAVGAGMVGALVQAFVAPPTVTHMDKVGDDITKLSGWWRNRLARLVLIFIFANVFSSIGSFAAFAWFPT